METEQKPKIDGRSLRKKRPLHSAAMRKFWQNSENKARMSQAQKEHYEKSPERKEKITEHLRSPRMRGIVSRNLTGYWERERDKIVNAEGGVSAASD